NLIRQQVAQVLTESVGDFRWARRNYSPVLRRSHTIGADGSIAHASLASGDAVAGSLELLQWSGDSSDGSRRWSGNTLVGPAGTDYWIALNDWDIVAVRSDGSATQHQAQDAHLRLGRYAAATDEMPVLHGIGLDGGSRMPYDGLVLALAFRYQRAGGDGAPAWQLNDYNGAPVQCGLWLVPAGQSLSQAQKDPSLLVRDLSSELAAISPKSAPAFRLDVDAEGRYRLHIDSDGDRVPEHELIGGVPLDFPAQTALVIGAAPAGGAKSGTTVRSSIRLDFAQAAPDAIAGH
ncbi:MAG: hypothetical protein ACOCXA_06445, partial [Planctomycetota bacterium]